MGLKCCAETLGDGSKQITKRGLGLGARSYRSEVLQERGLTGTRSYEAGGAPIMWSSESNMFWFVVRKGVAGLELN